MAVDRPTRLLNLRNQVLANSAARRVASDKKVMKDDLADVSAGIPPGLSTTLADFEGRIAALE